MKISRNTRKCISCNVLIITLFCFITRLWIPASAGEKVAVGGSALLAEAYASAASVNWGVDSSYYVGDFDPLPGNEIVIVYLVENLSDPGDANGMISFTVQGGSNQGVYDAFDDGSFVAQIFDDYTTWSGSVIGAGGNSTFYLYASYTGDPLTGTASAVARGIYGPVDFEDKDVWTVYDGRAQVPVIRTVKTSTPLNAPVSATIDIAFPVWHTYAPFQIASTTNLLSGAWITNSPVYTVTGAVTSVTVTNSAKSAFFKVVGEG